MAKKRKKKVSAKVSKNSSAKKKKTRKKSSKKETKAKKKVKQSSTLNKHNYLEVDSEFRKDKSKVNDLQKRLEKGKLKLKYYGTVKGEGVYFYEILDDWNGKYE